MGALGRQLLLQLILSAYVFSHAASFDAHLSLPLPDSQQRRSLLANRDDSTCNIPLQWFALILFYYVTGGDSWVRRDGWPNQTTSEDETIAEASCIRTFEGQNITLNPHCCWFGIFCCLSNTCRSNLNELPVDSCNCTVGSVTGISLPFNNLTGSLDGTVFKNDTIQSLLNISVVDILSLLSCNLRGLGLQNNDLSGGLPTSLTMLSELQTLNLGYNRINGTLPTTLGNLTAFRVLELTNNQLTGPIPSDLCAEDGSSPLTDLFLGSNMLTGSLNISQCQNIILIDAANNQLSGSVPHLLGYPILHIVHLDGNRFSGTIPDTLDSLSFAGNLVTDLNLASNNLTGPVPKSVADLVYLTSLSLQNNSLTGQLPPSLFSQLGTLTYMDARNNQLSGTIPESIGQANSLMTLYLSDNLLTGVIPNGLVTAMASSNKLVDLRQTYLSCCGVNFSQASQRYTSYNASAPVLPAGLSLSMTRRFVASYNNQSYEGMSCPYLYPSASQDRPENFLNWLVDPQYFMFKNCTCQQGFLLKNVSVNGKPNVTCVAIGDVNLEWWQANPWIWIIICLVIVGVFMALIWWCVFRRGSRPVVLQNLIDMRKRLKGPPVGGSQVSIVVTDIEGFSNLMSDAPELTTQALLIHNNLIRKAKWKNFGFTIEQEGDSYAIAFHDAADAVKFCLQSQQLLARQEWPLGLFESTQPPVGSMAATSKPTFRHAGTALISSVTQRFAWFGRSGNHSLKDRVSPAHALQLHDQRVQSNGVRSYVSAPPTFEGPLDDSGDLSPEARDSLSITSTRGTEPHPSHASNSGAKSATHAPTKHPQRLVGGARPLPGLESVCLLDGLRVRMGIATGILPVSAAATGSAVMERAKVISDAAAGGQVLMCSATFKAVQHLCEELGCVDHNGTNLSKYNAQRAFWWIWGARKRRDKEDAVLLDMGHFIQCSRGGVIPVILTPQHLGLQNKISSVKDAAATPVGNKSAEKEMKLIPARHEVPGADSNAEQKPNLFIDLASIYRDDPATVTVEEQAFPQLWLYQVLTPSLVARGRAYGSKLALKEEWVMLDVPYFSAPGALLAPVSSADVALTGLELPHVTIAFCAVDDAKAYSLRNRSDARQVHLALQAVIRSVVRQVPGGYFVKEQDGELKFMLAFKHPTVALMVCMAIQECAMYADWPKSVHRQWPPERDGQQLLYRGPRLKMGVCKGSPRSIAPDHLGRADYFGSNVNQAARLLDAAAHGGQIVCEESLAQEVASLVSRTQSEQFSGSSPDPLSPTAHQQLWEQFGYRGSDSRMTSLPTSPPFSSSRLQCQTQEEGRSSSVRQPASVFSGGMLGTPLSAGTFGQLETWVEHHDEGADAGASQRSTPPTVEHSESAADAARPGAGPGPAEEERVVKSTPATGSGRRLMVDGMRVVSQLTAGPSTSTAVSASVLEMVAGEGLADTGLPSGVAPCFASEALNTVPGVQMEVMALHLGMFRFKGLPDPLSVVHIIPSFLAGRRFPHDPPKGKGCRVTEVHGVALTTQMPLLTIVDTYRKQHDLFTLRSNLMRERAASLRSCGVPGSPRNMIQRSWNSLHGQTHNLFWRTLSRGADSPRAPSIGSPETPKTNSAVSLH